MPYQRSRSLLPILLKRLKLWPVVGLLGVRQSGKSVLLRDLAQPKITHSQYVTLDSKTQRERALASPEAFAELDVKKTLIIDEIQKATDLFDALKLHVDAARRPGMYLVSGSTEFSRLTGVRESLTGRVGLLHLYPLILSELYERSLGRFYCKKETAQAQISLTEFNKKITRGGMPGMCFLRSEQEFQATCNTWLETTCYRDLQQVKRRGLEGGLALEVLSELAQAEEPTVSAVAKKLRKDARIIVPYFEAFVAILVLHKVEPHAAGVGKAQYVFCDSGIASHLGSKRETLLRTHLLNEVLATFENTGYGRPLMKYYRNQKTSHIPLIFDFAHKGAPPSVALHYFDGESLERREVAALQAFSLRTEGRYRLLLMTQTTTSFVEKAKFGAIEIHPLRG